LPNEPVPPVINKLSIIYLCVVVVFLS